MNVSSNHGCLRLKPPLCGMTNRPGMFPPRNHFGEFRVFCRKRRRLKRYHYKQQRSLVVVSNSLFDGSFPIDSLTPTVFGVASALTIYISSRFFGKLPAKHGGGVAGEWILFTSPTPFNRFVLLRCPTISFNGGEDELLESASDRLVKEERHFVRLDAGKIPGIRRNEGDEVDGDLEYQRVCVSTEDGGVVSLDWPASLNLREERGLDTTVFLVPGTPDGSMDRGVRSFVCDAVRRGLFPVVMNPRGCASSPLTTARLFTAADSDDIAAAVQFIMKARPWTTLMGVGWGYGANMLTKYLAEAGDRTPLTAAACIDNPFDLEEVTRSFPYNNTLDQQLADGLIDILRSNKELFQGRAKRFDVEKALSAKSVRDFEKAISMVTYGFENIEEFYTMSSTRSVVGNIKIPVLFIQNDDGMVPMFSIPRGSIAENQFTSLLLCSLSPSSATAGDDSAVSWCHSLITEWLTAVELGLLKGRHPLLKDVDVTVNPSKGLALVERSPSGTGGKVKSLMDPTRASALNGHPMHPGTDTLEDKDTFTRFHPQTRQDTRKNIKTNTKSHGLENADVVETKSVEAEIVDENGSSKEDAEIGKENASSTEDSEHGQALQTTQMIMNMLDVTSPGTLKDEEKKKVLAAVDRGETIVKALQDAVPEDVRGKLTAAVSGIMHSQGTKLKFDRLNFSNASPALKLKTEEQVKGPSSATSQNGSSAQMKTSDDSPSIPDKSSMNDSAGETEAESHFSESQKSVDSGPHHPMNNHEEDISARRGSEEAGIDHQKDESLNKEKAAPSFETGIDHEYHDSSVKENVATSSDSTEKVAEGGPKFGITGQTEISETGNATVDENKSGQDAAVPREEKEEALKSDQDAGIPQEEKEEDVQKNEERTLDSSENQSKVASANMEEGKSTSQGYSSESKPIEDEEKDNQKKDSKSSEPVPDESKPLKHESNQPAFSVSQAFSALTGFDDSTQVAVNSVFGVLENMITQLEEGNNGENESKDGSKTNDGNTNSALGEHPQETKEGSENGQSDISDDPCGDSCGENNGGSNRVLKTEWMNKEQLVGKKLLGSNSDWKLNDSLSNSRDQDGYAMQHGYFEGDLSDVASTRQLDLDMTTALLLDYYPEDGQWKLLDRLPENFGDSTSGVTTSKEVSRGVHGHSPSKVTNTDNFIEPSYVILDTEQDHWPVEESDMEEDFSENLENIDQRYQEIMHFIKGIVLDSLKTEIQRRISSSYVKKNESQLGEDIEKVASAVSFAIGLNAGNSCGFEYKKFNSETDVEKIGTLYGETIIRAITSSVQVSPYLRKVLPVGVVVGSSLASLRKYFHISTIHDEVIRESTAGKPVKDGKRDGKKASVSVEKNQMEKLSGSATRRVEGRPQIINNNSVIVGAVTAALGASAFLVDQQNPQKEVQGNVVALNSSREKGSPNKEAELEELSKNQSNIITSLAEKAMSVAGPAVPTKEDGGVDQERVVAMLADLGQRGGILKLVGKLALLWGGLRGAMSLTNKLISFLRLSERPLLQRILGFIGMVLVLWSPVAVPMLPTLVQSWSTQNPSKMAELACIVGLYAAVLVLIMLWGKRIRGYENPLKQYGLDITSLPREKVQDFMKGLTGGIMLVLLIQSVNAVLGVASFSWPANLSSSTDAISWLRGYGQLLLLTVRGLVAVTGVVFVEELLFRSWLPEEITSDLGYHQGVVISGLSFSLFQRSPRAIPGMWLLSLVLAGARERSRGSLYVPVGLRAGIMASSYVLQTGRLLNYNPNVSVWITGTSPLQPFSGIVGLAFSLVLAIILYPRQPPKTMKQKDELRGG